MQVMLANIVVLLLTAGAMDHCECETGNKVRGSRLRDGSDKQHFPISAVLAALQGFSLPWLTKTKVKSLQ